MESHYLSHREFKELLIDLCSQADIYAPKFISEKYFFQKITPESIEDIALSGYRTTEPFKSFLFKPREKVVEYPSFLGKEEKRPTIVVGLKQCDIEGLKTTDKIFLEGDFIDPLYVQAREETLLISSDCQAAHSTCFCTVMGGTPYPAAGFDLNLSEIKDSFIVEVGSPKGKDLVEKHRSSFEEVTPERMAERDRNRKNILGVVKDINKDFVFKVPFEESLKKNFDSPIWKKEVKNCVECGACNLICPTCYCFLLFDQKKNKEFERGRVWDSCLLAGYARVAGGANPRAKFYERLRHRFQHKFDYFFDNYGIYSCSGCGRCRETCMAKIDVREVLRDLEANLPLAVKLE